MFKYYKGWRVLLLLAYILIIAFGVSNIWHGISGGNSYQWNLGITEILLAIMFVISDLRSGIIERQNDSLESYRGGLNA